MSSNDPFSWGDLAFDPLVPPPLVLLLALVSGVLTVWAYRTTGDRIPRGQNFGLLALRLLGLFLVLAILLQPSRIASIPSDPIQQVTLVAVDGSRSMRQTDAGQRSRIDAARELLRGAGLGARSESTPGPADLRLFRFGADAVPWT
ncbi:MAG: hypothetical protein JNL97_16145, partial [Verrucomicrobiales bacterium]|nr:hypothetical protein [Verrucomicrobiales bacterium]